MNIMNKVTPIITLSLIIGVFSAYPFYQTLMIENKQKEAIFQPLPLQGELVKDLDAIHNQVLRGIQQEFKIPQNQWDKALKAFRAFCAQDKLLKPFSSYKKSENDLSRRIKEALAHAGINPDLVTINYVNDKECPLVARQEFDDTQIYHYLDIDREWLSKRSEQVQLAIIAHEMEHLKHYDSVESGYIIEILEKNGYSYEDYNESPAVKDYRYQREFRADLLAAARDMGIAKALQNDLAQLQCNTNREDLSDHPSAVDRLNKVTALIEGKSELS
jgi:hypothetical protein